MPALPKAAHRQSISSTAATVADDDVGSLAAKPSSTLEQNSWTTSAASVRSARAEPVPGDSTAAPTSPGAGVREEQNSKEETGPAGDSISGDANVERTAQPDAMSESRVSTATANGSSHGAATSNDVDPFAETDAALHGSSDPQVHHLFAAITVTSSPLSSVMCAGRPYAGHTQELRMPGQRELLACRQRREIPRMLSMRVVILMSDQRALRACQKTCLAA